jgi:D-amino peptidase
MEGTAGIVDWAQCVGDRPEAVAGRELLLNEVNAAIDGAIAGGATEIVINDSHSVMRNLSPRGLHGRATYIAGRHKSMYMMQGLDASFDGVFYISYHGSMGSAPAVLSHTYNPQAVQEVTLNGEAVGESGINALVAAHYAVPILLVTGDQTACAETKAVVPGVVTAEVKHSISRSAAWNLHPDDACQLIFDKAKLAVAASAPVSMPSPSTLEVVWRTADMAEMVTVIRGVERLDARRIAITDDNLLDLFRTFVTCVLMTRLVATKV